MEKLKDHKNIDVHELGFKFSQKNLITILIKIIVNYIKLASFLFRFQSEWNVDLTQFISIFMEIFKLFTGLNPTLECLIIGRFKYNFNKIKINSRL